MTSAYLTRSEIPLAAALSRMLENIEAELADDRLDATQEERLRWRAELSGGCSLCGRSRSVESAGSRDQIADKRHRGGRGTRGVGLETICSRRGSLTRFGVGDFNQTVLLSSLGVTEE